MGGLGRPMTEKEAPHRGPFSTEIIPGWWKRCINVLDLSRSSAKISTTLAAGSRMKMDGENHRWRNHPECASGKRTVCKRENGEKWWFTQEKWCFSHGLCNSWPEGNYLVGGLVAFFFPRNIGFLIIPIDELIFFRGVAQPPTSCPQPTGAPLKLLAVAPKTSKASCWAASLGLLLARL